MCLVLKRLWLVSCDHMRIIVEVIFFSLMVYIGIVHNVILLHELFRVIHKNFTLTCNRSFLYVNRYLQVKMHILNVLVKEQQSTGVDFQVSVCDLKLLVSEESELILNELNSLLNSIKELGKCLSFLTFL